MEIVCACGCNERFVPTANMVRFKRGHWSRTPESKRRKRTWALARKPDPDTRICACGCGGQTQRKDGTFRYSKYISGHNSYGMKRGAGRYVNNFGYVMLRMPDHPQANRGYVLEHRWIMEQKLGRPLTPGETIHHINHDKTDNRP